MLHKLISFNDHYTQAADSLYRTAVHLRGSGRTIQVAIIIPYFDDVRLFSPATHPHGEDSLAKKIEQVQAVLAPYGDIIRWKMIISDVTLAKKGQRAFPAPETLFPALQDRYGLTTDQLSALTLPYGYRYHSYAHEITKGAPVYAAMEELLTAEQRPNIIMFTDVDISTDLRQIGLLLEPLVIDNDDATIGTRTSDPLTPGLDIEELLITMTSYMGFKEYLMFPLKQNGIQDTQCGFKAFRTEPLAQVLPKTQDGGWAFDTELLSLIIEQGGHVRSLPIDWHDSTIASLTNLKSRWHMLRDMFEQYIRRTQNRKYITENALFIIPKRTQNIVLAHINRSIRTYDKDTDISRIINWIKTFEYFLRWQNDLLRSILGKDHLHIEMICAQLSVVQKCTENVRAGITDIITVLTQQGKLSFREKRRISRIQNTLIETKVLNFSEQLKRSDMVRFVKIFMKDLEEGHFGPYEQQNDPDD